ncbi:DUF302 domain-containing protein [Hydrogenobacter hydrogenophilus]|uniref:Uncharacterized conserved protein, DUF302 family n=1 Tax=Hydrogenobacter hydrogenophilus TaxID=35835 RepID=A0A285NW97_9AQUI|nr:DUF302 domain-containing protein [Hydrogenobacter hydrogenophilus]SNZ13740.1 Uncharacterized conserved protein, DUF302 family [Hydrogenobacter hydrogenophilus]
MKKLLFILFLFPLLSLGADITSLMFYTYKVRDANFNEVVEELKQELNGKDLKLLRTLTISEAIKARGVKDFPNYTVLLACDKKEKEDLLLRSPFMSNLIPCSVAIYENKDGSVSITIVNEKPYLLAFSKEISKEDKKFISRTYSELRRVISSIAKPERRKFSKGYLKKMMRELKNASFETSYSIKGMNFDDVKTLLKSSLDGVNMNILAVEDVRKESPKYSFMLACNLTYGEKILREFPHFGTLAPCRIYLYEKPDGSVGIGYINIQTLIELYRKHLHKDAVEVFEKADRDIKSAIKEVKGE